MRDAYATPAIAAGAESFVVGDELVVFSTDQQALFRLNHSAAFIWACVEEGLPSREIERQLADLYGLEGEQAAGDVRAALRAWRSLGLLKSGGVGATTPRSSSVPPSPPPPLCTSYHEEALVYARHYQLLGRIIRFRYAHADLVHHLDEVLAPGTVIGAQPYDIALDLWADEQGWYLLEAGNTQAFSARRDGFSPLVLAHAVSRAYLSSDRLLGLHAAAVSSGRRCLVLPAESGSGKSTLTAALVASGYGYCTDELVVLSGEDCRLSTVPVAMSAKAGAWAALRPFYPSIDGRPVHRRADGKSVRYLLPESHAASGACDGLVAAALVFPAYSPGASAALEPLAPAEALCRLTAAGYDMEGGLDSARVATLIAWVCERASYALTFDDLDQAVKLLGGLLPRG